MGQTVVLLSDPFAGKEGCLAGQVLAGGVAGGVDQVTLKCRALNRQPCSKNSTTACLLPSQRFTAYVLNQNGSRATVASNAATQATFNVSGGTVTVKLINGCVPGGNNHFHIDVDVLSVHGSTEQTKGSESDSHP